MSDEIENETKVSIVHVGSSQVYINQVLGIDYTFPNTFQPENRLFLIDISTDAPLEIQLFKGFCDRNKLEPLFLHKLGNKYMTYLPASIELLDQMFSEGVIGKKQYSELYGNYYLPSKREHGGGRIV